MYLPPLCPQVLRYSAGTRRRSMTDRCYRHRRRRGSMSPLGLLLPRLWPTHSPHITRPLGAFLTRGSGNLCRRRTLGPHCRGNECLVSDPMTDVVFLWSLVPDPSPTSGRFLPFCVVFRVSLTDTLYCQKKKVCPVKEV